jgi:hypothetical protein
MRRVTRPLFAVVLCAFASIAHASSLRLLAPADGATLRGGSFAEVRWSASELPKGAEEWEAFLSVDGGKYYAFRITPHLDVELRRFTFVVPNVDTRDARILIRAGNEERGEQAFAPRGSFSIVRDAHADELLPRVLQLGHGEPAREGDPDVVAWADGARNGAGLTQQVASAKPSRSVTAAEKVIVDPDAFLAPVIDEVAAPTIAQTDRPATRVDARRAEPVASSVDLLLVCRRRNI